MYGESIESVYNKYGMSCSDEGMESGVLERVKRSPLRWFDHIDKMPENEMTECTE